MVAYPPVDPPDLEQLAAEGRQRRAEHVAEAAREADIDRELRLALGGHYGSPTLRLFAQLHNAALATLAAGLGLLLVDSDQLARQVAGAGLMGSLLLLPLRFGWMPMASPAQRDAEATWCRELPFTLNGYFEALRAPPREHCRLHIELELASAELPPPDVLAGLIHRADPGATPNTDQLGWQSGPVSGRTYFRENRRPVYRNHRLVKYVHHVVNQVFLPLHREYPLRSVSLRRED